jgi:GNAT superfamily N-acetyltransferase
VTLRLTSYDAIDIPDLAAMLSDWIDATPWMPRIHTRDEDRAFVAGLARTRHFRVARDGATLGFLARSGAEIEALYVAGCARRRGVGTALVAEAVAEEPMLHLWTFQANQMARAFYAARGFVETDLTDGSRNDERLPDVRMEWKGQTVTW